MKYMKAYTKESLELLRSRINLVEVLEPHVRFTKSGASYKGLCPFHDEKTPSFIVNRSDSHYHCFGCNAHGDAISFLMNYQKLSFQESVEYLADKFQVHLEYQEGKKDYAGPSKLEIKNVLDIAARFYNFYLMHTEDGKRALEYLYKRAVDLDFVKIFQIGYSPKDPYIFQKYMADNKVSKNLLQIAGLVRTYPSGQAKDFFTDRIMIPIKDAFGKTIGFTARKYNDEVIGGKYVNTPETLVFKKSKVLFGINYSRKQITKQRKAIVVEGQLDALRLIHQGYSNTIASQGTAFTEDHANELINLGINQVYIAFDSDSAGIDAAIKVGDIFQKKAIESYVLEIPNGLDPDSILIEHGPKFFDKLLKEAKDYLTFLVNTYSKRINVKSPAGKNELVQTIVNKIKRWEQPLMVHESLRKLAKLTKTPEEIIDQNKIALNIYQKEEKTSEFKVNPDLILEADILRFLFLMGQTTEEFVKIAQLNLKDFHFKVEACKNIYFKYLTSYKENKSKDLLSLIIDMENEEHQKFLSEILEKKINPDRAKESFFVAVQKVLNRHWMEKREEIRQKIQSGTCSDEKAIELAKKFDEIKNQRPEIILE